MSPAAHFRPLPGSGEPRPDGALPLAGGPLWFDTVAEHRRGAAPRRLPAAAIPPALRDRLTAPRAPVAGLGLDRPQIMGILNVTPDSFSDGGRFLDRGAAIAAAEALAAAGADMLDIGGESTRPGSDPVPVEEEAARVVPVVRALRAAGLTLPISVDTRNAAVAEAALAAGANLINDVSGLTHDPEMLPLAVATGAPVCIMHALGDPKTMQDDPRYDDVLLDVAEALEARVAAAEAAGLPRSRILIDPGIGFGKTAAHNLALVRGLALLHASGCGLLFGASRKRFIGAIGAASDPLERLPGSLAVALEALRQGAQVLRVHDVRETRQAAALWTALNRDAE